MTCLMTGKTGLPHEAARAAWKGTGEGLVTCVDPEMGLEIEAL